jgi:TonB-linked SusC/RagA family outer membrane protein
VSDVQGEPLPGVNIRVQGTTTGTTTDVSGKYSIAAPGEQSVLQFSFIGFTQQDVVVGSQRVINVRLEEDVRELDEVVVVGYGTRKKSDVTGALTSVSEKAIRERPVQNALQALQGKAAGVQVATVNRPGELPQVRIRGTRSFTNDVNGVNANDPLWVVDGAPLIGNMNDINPNDIASIEILKDASATAIYGSRAANGVVLVSTKRGSSGRVNIDYNGTLTFERLNALTDWETGGQSLDFGRLKYINGGNYNGAYGTAPDPARDIALFNNGDIYAARGIQMGYEWEDEAFNTVKLRPATAEEIGMGYAANVPVYNSNNVRTTDWADLVTRTGITNNHQISLSAGNDKYSVYTSIGYLNQLGTQKDQDYSRVTVRVNAEISPREWLRAGVNLNNSFGIQNYGGINNNSNSGGKDAYSRAWEMPRWSTPYDEDGNLIYAPGNYSNLFSPLPDFGNALWETRRNNVMANLFGEIRFTPWLRFRTNFSSGITNNREGRWRGAKATSPQTAANAKSATYDYSNDFSYLVENLLFMDKSFGKHDFGVTLMQSAQVNRREGSNLAVLNLVYDSSTFYNLGANTAGQPSGYSTSYRQTQLLSYMGRLNYTFNNKYLFTATGRYDGASVLAEGNKWDFFPSLALAWKMQEEQFIRNIYWISELKPRIGYGVTGSSSVAAYSTMGPLGQYNYVWGRTVAAMSYVPNLMPNPVLGWEKTKQMNFGVDFSVLNRRFSGSIDVYDSKTSDLLLSRSLPPTTGFVNITQNIGRTRNKGVEITLSSVNIDSDNFRWTTDINWSHNKEEILELQFGKGVDDIANNRFIGYPLQVYYGYKSDGLWQDTPDDQAEMAKYSANGHNFQPGDVKIVESGEKDYKITDEDRFVRGTSRPKWDAGLTNTFQYKNFSLNVFAYFRIGHTLNWGLPSLGRDGTNYAYGPQRVVTDYWTPENTDARWPKPTTRTGAMNYINALSYNDASFVMIRNISLSYNLPENLLNRLSLRNAQVFVQALNPFLFGSDIVKWGYNPDDVTGQNNNQSIIRSYVIGLRLGL